MHRTEVLSLHTTVLRALELNSPTKPRKERLKKDSIASFYLPSFVTSQGLKYLFQFEEKSKTCTRS
jgi:hypothetical protein